MFACAWRGKGIASEWVYVHVVKFIGGIMSTL